MKIIKTGIIRGASLGTISLQVVPMVAVQAGYVLSEEEKKDFTIINVPDEWIIMLRPPDKPCVGSQVGHHYLTRSGWKANKNDIQIAFEKAINDGLVKNNQSWNDFEKFADNHFKSVEKNKNKMLKKLQNQMDELKNMVL